MNPSHNAAGPNPLGVRPLPQLLRSFAVPSVLAMLVSSLYNIVDQIFIGNGVGYLGNAATNVAFPLSTICLSIALLIGVGGAARFNLSLGRGDRDQAQRTVGAAVSMMVVLGLAYMVIVELFLPVLLRLFGATAEVMPYAIDYTRITAVGMPLLIITNAMSNLARADGSPRYSMTCMLLGAVINTILDPIFIFVCHWGVAGAAWATASSHSPMRLVVKPWGDWRNRRSVTLTPQRAMRRASSSSSSQRVSLPAERIRVSGNQASSSSGAKAGEARGFLPSSGEQ